MKIRLLLLTFTVVSFFGVYAQTPGIPYQAVLLDKDASGVELPGMDDNSSYLMSNTLVSLRFSIHDADGKEFEEIHQSVMVDQYGMINVVVGRGTPTFNYFDDMDWNGEEKWLDVDIDFDNGSNFENLDYLPLHRLPSPGAQTISLLGDSIILSGGSGISLTQLLANAGTDDQQLSLVGTVLYLQDGGSIDLTQLATDTTFSNTLIYNNPTFVTNLAADSAFINTLTTDSVFLSTLDLVDNDNQNLTSFTLSGTELEVDIEDGDSVKVDLIGLANDSSFVTTLAQDTVFSNNLATDSSFVTTLAQDSVFSTTLAQDSIFVNTLAQDSVFISALDSVDNDNQNLTSFTLSGTELEVDIEDGDSVKVDLIGLANDSSFVTTLAQDTVFSNTLATDSTFVTTLAQDSIFVNTLAQDSVFISALDSIDDDNQNLTSFTLSGTELEVDIEDGDSVKVDLIGLATDSSFVNALTADSLFIDNLANDSILLQTFTDDRQEILILANNAQNQFNTPQQIDDINKIDVYRNGVKVGFTMFNVNTIQVETGAVCYQGDEIRIVQFF